MAQDKTSLTGLYKLGTFCFLLVGLSLLLCLLLGGRWCWWCSDDPVVDTPAATIVVEDMHAGIWMALENPSLPYNEPDPPSPAPTPTAVCEDTSTTPSWGTCDPVKFDSTYRHGMVFQMGLAPVPSQHEHDEEEEDEETADTRQVGFGGIYIKHIETVDGVEQEVETVLEQDDEWDWLDVREPGSDCVLDPLNAYGMFIATKSGIAGETLIVETECDPIPTTDPEYSCSRARSLHASLEPRWMMTYWAGNEFFDMQAATTDELTPPAASHEFPKHVSYTFKLPNEVTVDQWHDGCWQRSYSGVTEIRILYHRGKSYHNGYPHVPMDGGDKEKKG